MISRIIAGIIGALMAATAAGWLLDPKIAAGSLGMSYMDGIGCNTLVRDMSVFFRLFGCHVYCRGGDSSWALPTKRRSAVAASRSFRTTAWALRGAEFATTFIVFEIVMPGLLFF